MRSRSFTDPAAIFAGAPLFPVRGIPPTEFRNGIAARMPNHLGDAVMALPALRALRSLLPRYCALHAIAPAAFRPLFEAIPEVDGFLPLERPHRFWSWHELRDLEMLRPGVGVLFNRSFRDAAMMRAAGIPLLCGPAGRGGSLFFRRSLRYPPLHPGGAPATRHQARRYFDLAQALGATGDPAMPRFDLSRIAGEIPAELRSAAEAGKLLLLAPGAAYGPAKRWPAANFRCVAAAHLERGGTAAAVGAAAEAAAGAACFEGLPADRAVNLCGKTGLGDLMKLIRAARAVVANDSGVMHLAAALDVPGVAVFGSTDPAATAPVSAKWRVVAAPPGCAPCLRRECPRAAVGAAPECMAAVRPGSVLEELDELLAAEEERK